MYVGVHLSRREHYQEIWEAGIEGNIGVMGQHLKPMGIYGTYQMFGDVLITHLLRNTSLGVPNFDNFKEFTDHLRWSWLQIAGVSGQWIQELKQ